MSEAEVIDKPAQQEVTQAIVKRKPGTWAPGQSGNPAGRRSAGARIIEWIDTMQELTPAEVYRISQDRTQPVNRIAAAKTWCRAVSDRKNASGNYTGTGILAEIIDRTHGKAMQNVQVTHLDAAALDLTKLESVEVATFYALLSKATGQPLQLEAKPLSDNG